MILLLVSLFLWNIPSFVFSATPEPKINCLIINLDYVNCTWSDHELKYNYSFKSRFSHCKILNCSTYHKINGVNVGCKFPYKEKQMFNSLNTWLYRDNGSLVTEQNHYMKEYVKLNPPFNLSVLERKDAELWLYWNVTNDTCIESEVRHRTDNNEWKKTITFTRSYFRLPFPSKKRYEFQVRAQMCFKEYKFWSDWSESVYWGSLKTNNDTGEIAPPVKMFWRQGWTSLLLCSAGAVLLIMLSCLMGYSKRLRKYLKPVVPNAGRNVEQYLASLFDNDGNIEKWLSIPMDLENGFKPNFTDHACPVREYRMVSQSSSDSESMLSNPTDLSSDYQCMHSDSSASTIPGPAEALPTQDPSPVDNPV